MQIEMIGIEKIKPYGKNPRNNDAAVDSVAASIREFGFKVPIVVATDGTIVTGHTRYKAAIKLQMQEIPCIRAEDLTSEQIIAFRIADNSTNGIAQWNIPLLAQEINLIDLDMEVFGLNMSLLDTIDPIDLDQEDERDAIDYGRNAYHCPKCGFAFEVSK
jgi:site-specific DNA-methyltransferase (adenine-specific)